MSEGILLGFEVGSGEPVYMPLHHLAIFGMTQLSGKTTALEAVISRSGLKAIAFKTKRGESGFSSYHEIQPFFIEQSDWRYVSSLLEAMLRERMKFERSWIIKATKGTKNLKEVYGNVKALREKARRDSLTESVYVTLEEYLADIIPQIEKFSFSKELRLIDGINVMDLSEMSLEMRSLVIRSVMEHVINGMNNIVVVVPEAWEYLPQGRATPVKLYAETFIRKGASIGNYLFVDSQDVAGIDKTPLRSCDNWIMGRQKETHEVERFREIVGKNVSEEEIKSLPIGHFVAYLGDEIKRVYVLPANVPEEVGRKVATGELTPDFVRDNYLKRKEVDEEMVWKQKYDELAKQVEKIRLKAFEEGQANISKDLVKDNKFLSEERDKEKKERERLVMLLDDAKKALETQRKNMDDFSDLANALVKIIHPRVQIVDSEPTGPSAMSVEVEQPAISVKVERKQLEVSDKDLIGKIAIIYSEGDLGEAWFTVSNLTRLFEKHAWPRDPRASTALDSMTQWGFLEKRYSGKRPEYRVKMKAEDAKSKNLLRIVEA